MQLSAVEVVELTVPKGNWVFKQFNRFFNNKRYAHG
jgi:hypothetical protein